MQTALLDSPAQDLLTCIAYDFTGSLLATSSLDHSIHVFHRETKSLDWALQDAIKADAPVLKCAFGSGEWEHLLAAGLADGSARIYASDPATSKWRQRASLNEGRGSLRDLAFAPFDVQQLKIVTLAADCCLRLYECMSPVDVPSAPSNAPSGLASWTLIETIDLATLPASPCSSQSVGSISGFSSVPANSSAFSSVGATTSRISVGSNPGKSTRSNLEALSGYSLSWCKETYYGEALAVAAGPQGLIRVRRVFALT
jgi:nucleoporin SEH1